MKLTGITPAFAAIAAACLLFVFSVSAEEKVEKPQPEIRKLSAPIREVCLFKNGYGYIKRAGFFSQSGLYEIDRPIKPVAGSLWLDTPATVHIRTGKRQMPFDRNIAQKYFSPYTVEEMQEEADGDNSSSYQALIGRPVGITYRTPEKKIAVSSGVMQSSTRQHAVLKTSKGYLYINHKDISTIETVRINAIPGATMQIPYIQFDIHTAEGAATTSYPLNVNYITHGIMWQPSYKIDLTEPLALKIEQQATIRNELEDLKDVRVRLISGYPNIAMLKVAGLISPMTSINDFQRQLRNLPPEIRAKFMISDYDEDDDDDDGDGWDAAPQEPKPGIEVSELYFRDAGIISLPRNTAFLKSLDKKTAPYENLVEWNIPSYRDYWGRMNRDDQVNPASEDIWESIRFKNPFTYPITAAPVSFVKEGEFIGQDATIFVSAGEETTLHITKAMNIRVTEQEKEQENSKLDDEKEGNPEPLERFKLYGHYFQIRKAEGKLTIKNLRKTAAKIIINKELVGKLLKSSLEPTESKLVKDGLYGTNPTHKLKWEIRLGAGNEKTITYSYKVTVRM